MRDNTFLFSVISHTGAVGGVAPFPGLLPHCETKSGRRPGSEDTVNACTSDFMSKAGISAKCVDVMSRHSQMCLETYTI